jgi:putative nucleotidyltransferase with HDIG domain
LLARIANIAQTVEVFHDHGGVAAAHRVVRERSGRWFDPTLARIVLDWSKDDPWWALLRGDVAGAVVAAEPSDRAIEVDDDGLDGVARAFADIIDAKSPFTFGHSMRVATMARHVARKCGLDATEQRRIYRAGLLHDIGKLGVSNLILDKNGPLTDEEREKLEQHPRFTLDILERVSAFRGFARIAALHHEKLDGSGYPFGYTAPDLDIPERILVVCDIYDALASDRPYRKGMVEPVITSILERDRGTRLDPWRSTRCTRARRPRGPDEEPCKPFADWMCIRSRAHTRDRRMNWARALHDIASTARTIKHTRAALARDTVYMPSELAARLLTDDVFCDVAPRRAHERLVWDSTALGGGHRSLAR